MLWSLNVLRNCGLARGGVLASTLLFGWGVLVGCDPRTTAAPSTIGGAPGPETPGPGRSPILSVSSFELPPSIVLWANFVERPITFSWSPVPGATSYILEVGTSPGASDVFSASTTGRSLTTTFTTPGRFYPQVRARNSWLLSPANARIPMILFSFKDYVEALFLGTGPLAQVPQAGCVGGEGRMAGWPANTTVSVILASSLNDEQRQRAPAVALQLPSASAGVLDAAVIESSDPHPSPGDLQIAVQQVDLSTPFPCSAAAGACTVPLQFSSAAVLSRVSVLLRGQNTRVAHELGHALYGFCHLSTEAGYVSLMGNFEDVGKGLSEADLAATQAVYRTGLRAGATRSDFVGADLIKP